MIKENNKIIAEFMNLNGRLTHDGEFKYAEINGDGFFKEYSVYYHSDWNWLMKVVEKIENIKLDNGYQLYDFNITSFSTTIIDNFDGDVLFYIEKDKKLHNSKLDVLYEAVIEFINFYNKQKEK